MSRASDNRSRTLSTGPMQQLLFNSSDLISNNSSAGKQAAAASRTGDAIYTSKSENGQGIFLIRMTQPKGEVPLLVVSNEEGKSHSMDLRSLTCVNGSQLGCGILLPVGAQQGSPGSSSGGTHFISVHPSHTLTFQAAVNSCKGAEKQNGLGVQSTAIKTNSSTAEIFLMQSAALTAKDSGTKERPTDKKVHLCDVEGCGRSFSTASYLRYHQAVHDGKKSLPCPEEGCDRSFSWPAHLKYHLLTHNNQRNFKCSHEGCGKMFYTPQQLSVHQRTHTGVKPFVCREPGCDRAFTTAGNLKNHSRVHSGERPYVCSHQNCGKQFAEYSSLKKHKLTHTGEKPYSCEECGKKFSQSGSCSVHIRGHMANQDGRKRRRLRANPDAINQKVVVRRGNVLQYQDVAVSESVVYSQMVGDHVVTVTTQPSDREADNLDLNQGILGAEEVMTSEECIQTDGICDSSSMGANVVVLSQPHDIVSMGGNILNSDLDHEEIAGEGISHHSPESGTNHAIDPMMETDEDSGNESVWVEND